MNKKIICKPLDINYIDLAISLAQESYEIERSFVPALLETDNREYYRERLEKLFKEGIGRIAFEDDIPVGFMAFSPTYDIGNGAKGVIMPLYGYGMRSENRGKICGYLFQATAEELCKRYAQSLRICVYAHDMQVLNTFIMLSFAMDTTDVIRNTSIPVPANDIANITFAEMTKAEILEYRSDILCLYRNLINHLRISPVFYHCQGFLPLEDRIDDFLSDDMRIFAAFKGNELVGMIDSEPTDINFAVSDKGAVGMGDVFIKPSYRGQGLGAALLAYANRRVADSGIERVFVTHGTINPTARGFWDRYFTNYEYTMTRRIDPQMLGVISEI